MIETKFPISKFYPPDVVRERRIFLKKFWNGLAIGRPVFVPWAFENKPIDSTTCRTPVQQAIDRLIRQADSPVDVIPSFSTEHGGTVTLASAFGGQTFQTENQKWHIEPIISAPDDAFKLRKPESPKSGLLAEEMRRYQDFLNIADTPIPPKVPDMQGPLQTAAMLWDSSDFLTSMYDAPESVHYTLNIVTEHIIQVIRFFKDNFNDAELMVWPPGHLPHEMGCAIVEDFTQLLSPELYEEFGLPYVNRISDAFGGVFIHCCAQFKQHWPLFKKIHNLRGLDTMYPFTQPSEIYETFPDIVHSIGVDYAEVQRNFKDKGSDAWFKFIQERTPSSIRWQFISDCDTPGTVTRQLAILES